VTGLVRAGDVIDVLAATTGDSTGSSTAVVVAARVRVLDVPVAATSSGLLGAGDSTGAGSGGGSVVVLAATTAQALDLARAAVGSRLSLVLRAG
jgi:Flp pilus assembly protein CpaB